MKIQLKSILWAAICGFILLLEAPSVFALALNEIAKALPGDVAAADEFGISVAVDGDTMVIGADSDSDDDNDSRSGSAYLLALMADDDDDDDDDNDDDDDDDDDDEDDEDDDEDDDD